MHNCHKKRSKYKTETTVKILVWVSGTGFSKLVPVNTDRSATLIENLAICK